MDEAEHFLGSQPEKTKTILQESGMSSSSADALLRDNQFALYLDQALVIAMKDEAQWMISNNRTAEKDIPDFAEYIYIYGLKAVHPEAVNVIK